ncbi:MAG: hypothetical protein L0Y44_07290 [Phycisphaerales bacterium]|nr:hypothetical protein [Phycisphaerales bacterium]
MKSYIRMFIGAVVMCVCVANLSGCIFAAKKTVHQKETSRFGQPTKSTTIKTTTVNATNAPR